MTCGSLSSCLWRWIAFEMVGRGRDGMKRRIRKRTRLVDGDLNDFDDNQ